jgi:hypothetical protein
MVEHSSTISTAAAEIVALINSRSQSPWPHEIEAIIAKAIAPEPMASPRMASGSVPKLASDIRAKIAELGVAYDVLGKLDNGPECDAAEVAVERLKAELCDLEKQIPKPPRSYADIRMRAELALYWSAESIEDMRRHGDAVERIMADLIEAVLQFAGRDFAKALAPTPASPALLPPLSPDHLRYREALAKIAKLDDHDYSPEMGDEEKEEAVAAACEKAMAIERMIWATPAKTLADLLLRGEMALYNENGVMATLDEPEAYYDERSVAQLIRAVVDVLGGHYAR